MKKLLSVVWAVLSTMLIFSSCAKKENIYALPEVPKGEAVITNKNVAKPDEIKIYSGGAVALLKQAEADTLWEFLEVVFNSDYEEWGANGWKTQEEIIEHKKKDFCLELIYDRLQEDYYGVFMILDGEMFDYLRYTEGRLKEDRFAYSAISADSGQGFAEAYTSLLTKIETLKP